MTGEDARRASGLRTVGSASLGISVNEVTHQQRRPCLRSSSPPGQLSYKASYGPIWSATLTAARRTTPVRMSPFQ
ncbi:hypothetical protein OG735_01345 [Streptomyces sp. NBC_01210]|uniref:hypothetical protein n=1 Tax=Streptomyces sp. NBC_01210 TaxID=2903774 RepID=UPI002E10A8F8|nr:hypothetical protein OG735_01345 [Streptomyces sp. NBC_01210]